MNVKTRAILGATALTAGLYIGINLTPKTPTHDLKPATTQGAHYIDEAAILGELAAQGEIIGGSLPMEKRVTYSADKWYGDKTVALTAIGEAKLGIKADDIELSVRGNTVTVRFPEAQVLALTMPFDAAIIEKDVGAFRKQLTEGELQALYREAREGVTADIERNRQAFEEAEDEVASVLKRLIGTQAGVENVKIEEDE